MLHLNQCVWHLCGTLYKEPWQNRKGRVGEYVGMTVKPKSIPSY